MNVLPCGDAALLVELAGLPEVLAFADAVRAAQPAGVLDVVPAARTVLLIVVPGTDLGALRRTVEALPTTSGAAPAAGEVVEIPVRYDGPDLEEVGRLTGLGPDGVVAAHTGTAWRVAFGGFAPGFAYLVGGDPRLAVGRRAEPRTSVPAGAVGLAGEYSGVYPRASPGGWQLIGRTDAVLWDVERGATLTPATTVRFVSTPTLPPDRTLEPTCGRAVPADRTLVPTCGRGLEVVATGPLGLVTDLGRVGLAATGVGRSGAADRGALGLGNRLVANAPGAAGIEVLLGGLAIRARAGNPVPLTVALTGAPAPADIDGRPVGHHALLAVAPGQVLRLGPPSAGLRTYVAVRGGITVDPVLGSRSTDMLAGLGPPPLTAGDVLPIGPEPATLPLVDIAPVATPSAGTVVLRAVLGPRADRIADPAAALTRTLWTTSSRSDRVGLRLEGPRLRHVPGRSELPSEGTVRGAIQVPPGGEPVLFLADHPVTGGYPVVAVVLDTDTDLAAQLRPGQPVRFTLVPSP